MWTNRSKESLTLDLKRTEVTDVLWRLLARSDVFVHNLAPGAMERLGFGAADVRRKHPGMVVCELSGYGPSGPYSQKKAYDLLVQSEAGLVSVTGTADEPSKVGISIADIASGMYAFSGIVAALLRRARTGEGATMHVSMLESLGEWMGFPAYYTGYGGTALPRTGARHAAIAPYGPYRAGDGSTVYLGIQNEREWASFCDQVLCRPELAEDPRFASNHARVAARETLDPIILGAFTSFTGAEVVARLDAAGIANARMNSVPEFLEHPQLLARDRWREIESPVGPLRALLPPFDVDGMEVPMGPIPALGEHTDAILTELGLDATTIGGWREAGII